MEHLIDELQLEGQSGTYDIFGNGKVSHSMTSHSPDLIPVQLMVKEYLNMIN